MKKVILSLLTTAGVALIADWIRNDPCIHCQKKKSTMTNIVNPCEICDVRKDRIERSKYKCGF